MVQVIRVMKEEKRSLVKVRFGRKEAEQIHYWMGRNTPLRELMNDYTPRIAISPNSVRFLFDGSAINPSSLPTELQMEDGDSIDAIRRDEFMAGTGLTSGSLSGVKEEDTIVVNVKARV
ncbi:hypothetical protein F3Y22_tig00110499pilonHSYRG00060 [Hibiscus syriacus]|uniref:Ubiquitin-like domain-containing protein n=1 Tax=Hibiscus syriacus TaxID=106335 RepID=A0A6A3ACD2_HIBSY|nr:hypothetical protein F3Y22_tig00110499pilonHSYRG00060 [Hibiscus syriacus]